MLSDAAAVSSILVISHKVMCSVSTTIAHMLEEQAASMRGVSGDEAFRIVAAGLRQSIREIPQPQLAPDNAMDPPSKSGWQARSDLDVRGQGRLYEHPDGSLWRWERVQEAAPVDLRND